MAANKYSRIIYNRGRIGIYRLGTLGGASTREIIPLYMHTRFDA